MAVLLWVIEFENGTRDTGLCRTYARSLSIILKVRKIDKKIAEVERGPLPPKKGNQHLA
jgi:hypothetical protein